MLPCDLENRNVPCENKQMENEKRQELKMQANLLPLAF